ncbi:hypothetical protein C8R43DRAFT_991716, partial [Mycena crocata]
MAPDPILPLELERRIFEICAHLRPVSIPKLCLVAWRVKEWVEPLLYRTIFISDDKPIEGRPSFTPTTILSTIETKTPAFFGKHVRNLLVFGGWDLPAKRVLPVCTGVDNLWIRCDLDRLVSVLESLSLRQLYADIRPLLSNLSPTHQFFSQITHLELIDEVDNPSPTNMGIWSGLPFLPQLAHLSFNDEDLIAISTPLLQSCKSLAVLVCLAADEYAVALDQRVLEARLPEEPRFVVMDCQNYHRDWQMGTHCGTDYWVRAEDFVTKRRSGEIDTLQYRIDDDASTL